MLNREYYERLIGAYSDSNLNRIGGKLIELYKSKKHSSIVAIAGKISDYTKVETQPVSRCFSRLMFLYHPDRAEYYRNNIHKLYESNSAEKLKSFEHIFLMDDMDSLHSSTVTGDIEYNPEYKWDESEGGFEYYFDDNPDSGESPFEGTEEWHTGDDACSTRDSSAIDDFVPDKDINMILDGEFEYTFFNVVKMRMYGTMDIELPSHYLEDFDDVEFADSHIESLDGIEHCKHVMIMDLSGNQISDISDLFVLDRIEELYLADNNIGFVDALSNLANLRVVDLSNNEITDITALLELEKLEFVNLLGNHIPASQVEQLKKNEVLVMI